MMRWEQTGNVGIREDHDDAQTCHATLVGPVALHPEHVMKCAPVGGGGGGGGGGSSAVDGSSHVNVMFSSLSSGSLNAFRMDSVKWRYPSGPGRTSKLQAWRDHFHAGIVFAFHGSLSRNTPQWRRGMGLQIQGTGA